MLAYWTKCKGVGGELRAPEDFVVRERLEPRFLRKFAVGKSISRPEKYSLILARKRGMTTRSAIKALALHLGVREADIGFAGLKDKFSVSYQYFTIKHGKEIEKAVLGNMEIIEVSKTNYFLSKGDLLGNEFEITLHGCSGSPAPALTEIAKHGMPNYFGPQRFGAAGNNHVIGRLILKRNFSEAEKLAKRKIRDIPKESLKFFVHAYQSWLFNEALSAYVRKSGKPLFAAVNIPGYETRLGNTAMEKSMKNLMKRDEISADDFRFDEMRMTVNGARRAAFVQVSPRLEENGACRLRFFLPKGAYATALLREVTKA